MYQGRHPDLFEREGRKEDGDEVRQAIVKPGQFHQ